MYKNIGKGRFDSLREIFKLNDRIIEIYDNISTNTNLLLEPLYIIKTFLNELMNFNVSYLKRNLGLL